MSIVVSSAAVLGTSVLGRVRSDPRIRAENEARPGSCRGIFWRYGPHDSEVLATLDRQEKRTTEARQHRLMEYESFLLSVARGLGEPDKRIEDTCFPRFRTRAGSSRTTGSARCWQ
jgi:hypothetical protein